MNTTMKVSALALAVMLAGCGGGGIGGGNKEGAAVTNITASSVQYSKNLTVQVSGSGFTVGGLQMVVEGPCGEVTKTAGGSDLLNQFTCKINGVGDLIPRIKDASGTELASMRLNVPNPQVTIAITQSTATLSSPIVLELDPVAAPVTAMNFMDYVNAGFYAKTIFHRVVKTPFAIAQGGSYTAGTATTAIPLPVPVYKSTGLRSAIVLESNNGLKNLRGTIAMARTSVPNSATSGFYFNVQDNAAFDYVDDANPGYAVFGKVVSGLDIMDLIGNVDVANRSTGFETQPTIDVTITSITQTK